MEIGGALESLRPARIFSLPVWRSFRPIGDRASNRWWKVSEDQHWGRLSSDLYMHAPCAPHPHKTSLDSKVRDEEGGGRPSYPGSNMYKTKKKENNLIECPPSFLLPTRSYIIEFLQVSSSPCPQAQLPSKHSSRRGRTDKEAGVKTELWAAQPTWKNTDKSHGHVTTRKFRWTLSGHLVFPAGCCPAPDCPVFCPPQPGAW